MDVNDDHQNHHHHFNNHTNQNNHHNQENMEGQSLIPNPNDSNQQIDGKKICIISIMFFSSFMLFERHLTSSFFLDDEADENDTSDQSTSNPQQLKMRSLSSLDILDNINDQSTASAKKLHSKNINRILSTSMIRNNQVETYS